MSDMRVFDNGYSVRLRDEDKVFIPTTNMLVVKNDEGEVVANFVAETESMTIAFMSAIQALPVKQFVNDSNCANGVQLSNGYAIEIDNRTIPYDYHLDISCDGVFIGSVVYNTLDGVNRHIMQLVSVKQQPPSIVNRKMLHLSSVFIGWFC